MEEGLCFRHKSNSMVESAWLDRRQELKFVDFDEIPTECDASDTLQPEKLPLKEAGVASSSASACAIYSKAHGKEIEEPFSCVSNNTALTSVQNKGAIKTSSPSRNSAIYSSVHGNLYASNQGALHKRNAKSHLYEICAANCWEPPSFICCKDEGPSHHKLFTFKATVKVEDATRTVIECFSKPRTTKKAAAEHAAEGALWCLQHLGYKI